VDGTSPVEPSLGHWHALYATDIQGVYALWVVPVAFLLFIRLVPRQNPSMVAPGASGLMATYALVFGLETILDPLAGGLMVRWLGLADGWMATIVMFAFVLLGDFRVLLLVFYLLAVGSRASTGRPAEIELGSVVARAASWTLLVPVATGVLVGLGRTVAGPLHPQVLWLVYELSFLVLAGWFRHRLIPRTVVAAQAPIAAYLRDILGYVAIYYALWATADVLIMAGLDVGWALRILPNQLYYAFYLPVAYALFFSSWYVETSNVTHASR